MKRFFDIILASIYALTRIWWIPILIFPSASLASEYTPLTPEWANILAAVFSTAIVVGIGAVSNEDTKNGKLRKDVEFLSQRVQEVREENKKEISKIQEEYFEKLRSEQVKYSEVVQEIRAEKDTVCKERDSLERKLDIMERDFDAYLKDTAQSSPWLASKIADTAALVDKGLIRQLRSKKNPAIKAAEQVKAISKEKRELLQRSKELEYQLQFYEGLFPWLEEFKTIPAPEAVQYVHTADSDYDGVRSWLSPEEYANLSASERNQLALDRYMRRKKSDWDVGIEYERYIGYLYENGGYHVTYNGATQGVSDMGRDIIAVKDGKTRVIQCKRWAKDKEIHEKHIFQLYGTTVLMRIENGKQCDGVFVTTARLSPLAMSCAKFLKIIVAEELKFKPYPLIKCNISKTGEKIYHLPFDQQYDRVQISGKDGAMFAWTVAEAEANGFRRAKRWIPEQTS